MNPNEPTNIQQFPTITFRKKSYPIKLMIGQLLRLKQDGLNLLEQPPADPFAVQHNQALIQLMEAMGKNEVQPIADQEAWSKMTPEEKAAHSPLHAKVDEMWAKVSKERKEWKGPLDKTDPLEITEIALKIVAEALRPHHPKITYMDLADEIDVNQAVEIVTKAFDAAKNLYAVRAGQTQTAE